MKFELVVFTFTVILATCYAQTQGFPNLMGSELQKCINCLCHARTGCHSRFNCANYSVSLQYWQDAGAPTLVAGAPKTQENYNECIKNEPCILATIAAYTERNNNMDCNCDGTFDCKDRLAVHLFGTECANPRYGAAVARRFNSCASQVGVPNMLPEEGGPNCEVETF